MCTVQEICPRDFEIGDFLVISIIAVRQTYLEMLSIV